MSIVSQPSRDIMQNHSPVLKFATAPIRTALFVDFDNIYFALGGPEYTSDQYMKESTDANRFAIQPQHWLSWIEHGMPHSTNIGGHWQQRRSVLIRRCYLNPQFGRHRYRQNFTQTAFSVVDCPTLAK